MVTIRKSPAPTLSFKDFQSSQSTDMCPILCSHHRKRVTNCLYYQIALRLGEMFNILHLVFLTLTNNVT